MVLSQRHSIKLIVLLLMALGVLEGCGSTAREPTSATTETAAQNAIDINRASATELMSLPGIGETLAARILEFREKNGPFRRPEQLLLVPGISEKKFRDIRTLIKTGPYPHDE